MYPQLSMGMSDKYKSGLFHLLLRFVNNDLERYDVDADLIESSVSPLQQILNRWMPIEKYNAQIGHNGPTWKEKLQKIHPSAIHFKLDTIWQTICNVMREEEMAEDQIPSFITFKKLCKINTTLINITSDRKKVRFGEVDKNFYAWIYPPHAEHGC